MNKNYTFKVGDRVQFKTWEEMEKEFGLDWGGDINNPTCFVQQMKHLCGTYATIYEIYNDDYNCELKDFTVKGGDLDWEYSLDMFKPVKKEKRK